MITDGPDGSLSTGDEGFIIDDIIKTDPLTVTVGLDNGPDLLTLESSTDNFGVDLRPAYGPNGTPTQAQQWEIFQLGSGIYSDFVKFRNVSTGTFLDLSNGTGSRVVGAKRNGNPSQLWNIIPVSQNLTSQELRNKKVAEQEKFQQAKEGEKGQQLTNVENSGGLGYINTDDYNRIVRSMGYPGVVEPATTAFPQYGQMGYGCYRRC
ncbi:hypothetical protein GP486_000356 [Trichoglossum hirsutum]|uniref:Ricin B lectin domain-containing protein n=1 Tax=Trichoglossum hirsutum TaxID=265104 RepID=A0A9P8RTM2_9PEZI|nr:hypothetical protein GP486_000356 [Trichoglossum hirsutum]